MIYVANYATIADLECERDTKDTTDSLEAFARPSLLQVFEAGVFGSQTYERRVAKLKAMAWDDALEGLEKDEVQEYSWGPGEIEASHIRVYRLRSNDEEAAVLVVRQESIAR